MSVPRSGQSVPPSGPSDGRSFPWLLATRYLRSRRGDALIATLSSVTAVGIALGVAALVISLAVLAGFQRALLDDVRRHSPQVQVELPAGADAAPFLEAAASVPGVRVAQEALLGRGFLLHGGRSQPIELVGFARRPPVWLGGEGGAGAAPPQGKPLAGALLSDQRVAEWALVAGDRVLVVTAKPALSPLGRVVPTRRQIEVAGSYAAPRDQPEVERVAVPLAFARSIVPGGARRLDLELEEGASAAAVQRVLLLRLPAGSVVETWRDLNRPLLFVLRLEKTLIFVAVFLIVAVAATALVAALALVLSAKQGEIGVLQAMGAAPHRLHRAFLLLGLLLAGMGGLAGAGAGVLIATVLDRYRLIPLPGGVYIVDHLPFAVRPLDVVLVVSATVLVSLLASRWAALRAAAVEPIEALRREALGR